jgi:ribonuclease P protein component
VKALPNYYTSRPPAPVCGPLRSCAPAPPDFDSAQGDRAPLSGPGAPGRDPRNAKPLAARFPRSSKLLRRADFQRVYKQGRRHFAAHMTVFYLRRDDRARPHVPQPHVAQLPSAGDVPGYGPRFGLTVGRVLGGAVQRNRIKRRLREAVRYNLASLALAVDVVINPKRSALTTEFSVLKDEVARAFQVIGEKESRRG